MQAHLAMLDFCSVCDNSLSISADDESVTQKCLSCGTVHPLGPGVHVIWESLGTAAHTEVFMHYVDPSIHSDPTIASLCTSCPGCKQERKVRYVRYGKGLNYLYACPDCMGFWTRSKGGSPVIVRSPDAGTAQKGVQRRIDAGGDK